MAQSSSHKVRRLFIVGTVMFFAGLSNIVAGAAIVNNTTQFSAFTWYMLASMLFGGLVLFSIGAGFIVSSFIIRAWNSNAFRKRFGAK